MYDIIKTVIESKQYELTDMIKKIDTQWISGKINDEQRAQLISLAQENANVSNSIDFVKKLSELEQRIINVENMLKNTSENPGDEYEEDVPDEFIPGKWYYNGNRIRFEGENYTCIAPEGQVCTWNPVEYPPYWQKEDSPLTV